MEQMTYEKWEEKYQPLHDENGDIFYETFTSPKIEHDYKALVEAAIVLANGLETQAYRYVWTRVEGDNDGMYLLSGFHLVNRQDYCLCTVPFDEDEAIEVLYD